MYYASIKKYDVANGLGVRVSLFVSGCTHHCKNCFNEEAWDFHYGNPFTEEVIEEVIEALRPTYIKGLSLLGGEPMEPANQIGLLPLLKRVKEEFQDTKDIWLYSGYLFEQLQTSVLLPYLDIIVDGKFVEELKSPALRFRGSSNQRIIDVKKSLKENQIVLWEGIEG